MALDTAQWLKDTLERKQTDFNELTSRTAAAMPNHKKQMIKYDIFAEFLEKQGYSIKYNQITHTFEFFGFDEGKSTEHLAENVPTILQDQLKEIYTHVSKQNVIDYITRYATRNKYNPVLNLIEATKWDGKYRIEEIYTLPESTEEGKYSRIMAYADWLCIAQCN